MYAEGSKTRLNYYVPIEQDNTLACKNAKYYRHPSLPEPPHAVHILGRRYALTSTSYKYLDIAISVGAVSCVELMLGDNRGNRMTLPIAIWKALLKKRTEIERFLRSVETTTSPLWIRDLAIEICQIHHAKVIKLTLVNTSIYLKPTTMFFLMDLEYCIDHMYSWLCENTHLANDKFKEFVNIIREQNITDVNHAAKAILESQVFDKESLIDCELLAYALNDILHDACSK